MPSLGAKASLLPLQLSIGTMACRILILSFFLVFISAQVPKAICILQALPALFLPLAYGHKKNVGLVSYRCVVLDYQYPE